MRFKAERQKPNSFFSMFMLMISLIFYLFFAFFDGAVICADSPSYIVMDISREPVYPMFLAFFRYLFRNSNADFYLTVIVFLQSVLAAFASWSLAIYLTKEFRLNRLFSSFLLFIPLAVSLLCRFAAKRGSMYSNSILTEGITISCYLLFFRFLFEYAVKQSKKSLLFCSILSFLLISTRKQMIFSLILLIICILYFYFGKKEFLKGAVTALLCTAGILFCNLGLDLGYNYALRGEAVRHSSDTRFITTMAFYTAKREDADYIEDAEIRNLFLNIYDICDGNGYLKHSAGEGWLNRVSHFDSNYDHIQIDTMWPLINEFADGHSGSHVTDLSKNADQIMNVINHSLVPHNIFQIAITFTDNFFSGLVTTVAQRHPVLIWYSLFVYLFYILLLIYHIRKTKNKKVLLFSTFALFSVILNVGLVSLVIFCQTRYTIYNMALFYISLLLMIKEPLSRLSTPRQIFPQ